MTTVLVPIADGSEDIETATIIDVLRRAEFDVCVASAMTERKQIKAARGMTIVADHALQDVLEKDWDMIALPGGMPGAQHLGEHQPLVDKLRYQLTEGKWLAAICASPAVVLAQHKLISSAAATCFPGFRSQLEGNVASVSDKPVVIDKNLITSQGPGTAMAFALTLVEVLSNKQKAKEIADALLFAYE